MLRHLPLLGALLLVLVLPLVLQPGGERPAAAGDETLVIISPHNEAIRTEFGRAFSEPVGYCRPAWITSEFRDDTPWPIASSFSSTATISPRLDRA